MDPKLAIVTCPTFRKVKVYYVTGSMVACLDDIGNPKIVLYTTTRPTVTENAIMNYLPIILIVQYVLQLYTTGDYTHYSDYTHYTHPLNPPASLR